jgi:hypothetical protein
MISPWNVPLGKVWGWPWHGLVTSGVLALPNGGTFVPPNAASLANGEARPLNCGAPAVVRTPEEAAQDAAAGRQWRNQAIVAGPRAGSVHGVNLPANSWIYVDAAKARWLVTCTGAAALSGGVRLSLSVVLFGVWPAPSPVPSHAATLDVPGYGVGDALFLTANSTGSTAVFMAGPQRGCFRVDVSGPGPAVGFNATAIRTPEQAFDDFPQAIDEPQNTGQTFVQTIDHDPANPSGCTWNNIEIPGVWTQTDTVTPAPEIYGFRQAAEATCALTVFFDDHDTLTVVELRARRDIVRASRWTGAETFVFQFLKCYVDNYWPMPGFEDVTQHSGGPEIVWDETYTLELLRNGAVASTHELRREASYRNTRTTHQQWIGFFLGGCCPESGDYNWRRLYTDDWTYTLSLDGEEIYNGQRSRSLDENMWPEDIDSSILTDESSPGWTEQMEIDGGNAGPLLNLFFGFGVAASDSAIARIVERIYNQYVVGLSTVKTTAAGTTYRHGELVHPGGVDAAHVDEAALNPTLTHCAYDPWSGALERNRAVPICWI